MFNYKEEHTLEAAPDVYPDLHEFFIGPWGAALKFSRSKAQHSMPGKPLDSDLQAIVRMSPTNAKVLAIQLLKSIKKYEREELGDPLPIAPKLLAELGIEKSEWAI